MSLNFFAFLRRRNLNLPRRVTDISSDFCCSSLCACKFKQCFYVFYKPNKCFSSWQKKFLSATIVQLFWCRFLHANSILLAASPFFCAATLLIVIFLDWLACVIKNKLFSSNCWKLNFLSYSHFWNKCTKKGDSFRYFS